MTWLDWVWMFEEHENCLSKMKKMLSRIKTVLKENHVQIEKVRAMSSKFSYTVVTILTWSF